MGVVHEASSPALDQTGVFGWQCIGHFNAGLLLLAVVLNGMATGMYIGAGFGAGPRDGLMTGIHARTGWPIRRIRTTIELSVLVIGMLLGGTFGVGTVLYALAIGPLIQIFLPWFQLPRVAQRRTAEVEQVS